MLSCIPARVEDLHFAEVEFPAAEKRVAIEQIEEDGQCAEAAAVKKEQPANFLEFVPMRKHRSALATIESEARIHRENRKEFERIDIGEDDEEKTRGQHLRDGIFERISPKERVVLTPQPEQHREAECKRQLIPFIAAKRSVNDLGTSSETTRKRGVRANAKTQSLKHSSRVTCCFPRHLKSVSTGTRCLRRISKGRRAQGFQ